VMFHICCCPIRFSLYCVCVYSAYVLAKGS
jgi:hypothetical protein